MAFSRRRSSPSRELRMLVESLGIPPLHQITQRCVAELRRARRYERPLTVLFLGTEAPDVVSDDHVSRFPGPASDPRPPAFTGFVLLGSFLLRTLRGDDILASATDGLRYVLLLPEADQLDAERALRRITDGFSVYAQLPLRNGFAQFPRDGLTLESLLDEADRAWRANQAENRVRVDGVEPVDAREASRA